MSERSPQKAIKKYGPLALPLLGGMSAIHAGYVLDDFVNPLLVWGGDACPATTMSCGTPAGGLMLLVVVGALIGSAADYGVRRYA